MIKKMPYIADKTMFKAVMFACKIIREKGWFNKAVKTASNYYGVDAEELAKHIRARQSVGQTGTMRGKQKIFLAIGRTYEGIMYKDELKHNGENLIRKIRIVKGFNEDTIKHNLNQEEKWIWERENGELSATYWFLVECKNMQEAEEKKQKLLTELNK